VRVEPGFIDRAVLSLKDAGVPILFDRVKKLVMTYRSGFGRARNCDVSPEAPDDILPTLGQVGWLHRPTAAADPPDSGNREAWSVCLGGTPADGLRLKLCWRALIPELQSRGLFRAEYEGTTLQENMGSNGRRVATSHIDRIRPHAPN
jgi:hypothetical protein